MSLLWPEKSGILLNSSKGALAGALLVSGFLGVKGIYDYLLKNFEEDEDAPEYEKKKVIPKFLPIRIKKAADIVDYFMYGASLPIGGVIAFNTIEKSIDSIRKAILQKELKKRDKLLQEQYEYKVASDDSIENDLEINAFIDGFLDTLEKKALDISELIEQAKTLAELIPIGYGAVAGTGAIAGYLSAKSLNEYLLKNMYKPLIESPTIIANLPKKKVELEKSSQNKLDAKIIELQQNPVSKWWTENISNPYKQIREFSRDKEGYVSNLLTGTLKRSAPFLGMGALLLGSAFAAPSIAGAAMTGNTGTNVNVNDGGNAQIGEYNRFNAHKGVT